MNRPAAKMMPSAHLYGHHQFAAAGPDSPWMQQQQGHSQQQQHAQQQHYNRLAALGAAAHAGAGGGGGQQDGGPPPPPQVAQAAVDNVSEENRRTMAYIADLLNEGTREAALLELSKKREQVPELALILWHSFGGWHLSRVLMLFTAWMLSLGCM